MDEVRSAVNRIDNPAVVGRFITREARLFTDESVFRVRREQRFFDDFFCGLIDFRHHVVCTFTPDFDFIHIEAGFIDNQRSSAGGGKRRVKHRRHDFPSSFGSEMSKCLDTTE